MSLYDMEWRAWRRCHGLRNNLPNTITWQVWPLDVLKTDAIDKPAKHLTKDKNPHIFQHINHWVLNLSSFVFKLSLNPRHGYLHALSTKNQGGDTHYVGKTLYNLIVWIYHFAFNVWCFQHFCLLLIHLHDVIRAFYFCCIYITLTCNVKLFLSN